MIETIFLVILSMVVSSVVTAFIIIKSKVSHTTGIHQKSKCAETLTLYKKQAENISELRKFRHDYKNQLAGLQILLESGEYDRATAYLSEIHNKFSAACDKVKTYSDHILIDAILQNLACKCAQSNIKFDASVMVQDKLPLTDADTCTLFSNIADNAYEAALLSCRNGDKNKLISFTTSMRAKWLIINVENSYDGVLHIDSDGNFLTRKDTDSDLHGIGLKSISSIMESVNGAQLKIEPDTNNAVFRLTLIFPL